ncbi:PREDICTED: G patch domain-containing protein 4 [Nipponia nippon]|uniref:G patch domain-containing protein 4 n=1 Tax=Nipponia nippon TaxID=128390 RepID=UPI0005109A0D|nr:PREDICTED: G patch domain-containing protein 4 [Nipponia nippon]
MRARNAQDGISMKTLSEEGVRISTKKPRKAGSTGSMLYGRFVKAATLTARGEESTKPPTGSESSEEEEEEKLDLSSARRLTDEELMRACGGRTAHKGARHGLTMSAKLARLEEQERAFLAAYRGKERQPAESSPPGRQGKRKKKTREEPGDGAAPEGLQSQEPKEEEEDREEPVETKKKKRKKKKEDKEEPAEPEVPLEDTNGPDEAGHSPRKKRRKREPE